MAADDLAVGGVAQHVNGAGRDIAVGGAVEAVAADVVLLVVLVGNGVDIGLGGHGHVERGVEDGDLGGLGHDLLAGLDAHQVGGVVKGAEGNALFDGFNALVVDDAALGEGGAAVEDAVADGVDLVGAGDHALLRIDHDVQNGLDGLVVGGHGDVVLDVVAAGDLMGQLAVDADALAEALGEDLAGVGVHKLILEGRTACVDDQDFHCVTLLKHIVIGMLLC